MDAYKDGAQDASIAENAADIAALETAVGTVEQAAEDAADVAVTFTETIPVANDSTGAAGTIAFNATTLFICVATDTWKKVAIADVV